MEPTAVQKGEQSTAGKASHSKVVERASKARGDSCSVANMKTAVAQARSKARK